MTCNACKGTGKSKPNAECRAKGHTVNPCTICHWCNGTKTHDQSLNALSKVMKTLKV